ncbi:hypothetical protein E3U55_10380 [Filobacillus milosensis]|uniref:Immunity protein 70 n=1 Tax=Filobacillus milosensis TaxID=94137 RepID=A0A4Y8IFW3_9BACI|nr:Imm70 family immunity protein [Filobacillus milosensis]TFB19559.1 hypothetical protein E3U55_10380 [Filobacillus milosensis]
MAVYFQVDFNIYRIGHGDFLHSFFSTISYHLESDGWGAKYPLLLNELYFRGINSKDISNAIQEVEEVKEGLKTLPPSEVVWDIEDLDKVPPWGNDISQEITNLSNYFVTSDGRDLFDLLLLALNDAIELESNIEIVSR